MAQHIQEKHPELHGSISTAKQAAEVFKMKIIRKHSNCMSRQIHEAIRIRRSGETVLNNKEEYTRCLIPSLTVPQKPPSKPDPRPDKELGHISTDTNMKKKRPRTRSEARQNMTKTKKTRPDLGQPQHLRDPAGDQEPGVTQCPPPQNHLHPVTPPATHLWSRQNQAQRCNQQGKRRTMEPNSQGGVWDPPHGGWRTQQQAKQRRRPGATWDHRAKPLKRYAPQPNSNGGHLQVQVQGDH